MGCILYIFSSLATLKTLYNLKAYRKHSVNPLLAPRQSVTEFISQSSAVFSACLSLFPQVLCTAQHTWDDDSSKKEKNRSSKVFKRSLNSVLQVSAGWEYVTYVPLGPRKHWFMITDIIITIGWLEFCDSCFHLSDNRLVFRLCCCFPGTALRDRTRSPRGNRGAADVLHSHLSKRDCRPWSKTLLQHQTRRDGQWHLL